MLEHRTDYSRKSPEAGNPVEQWDENITDVGCLWIFDSIRLWVECAQCHQSPMNIYQLPTARAIVNSWGRWKKGLVDGLGEYARFAI